MKFAVKTVTCLGCKTPLRKGKYSEDPAEGQKVQQCASIVARNSQNCIRNK